MAISERRREMRRRRQRREKRLREELKLPSQQGTAGKARDKRQTTAADPPAAGKSGGSQEPER